MKAIRIINVLSFGFSGMLVLVSLAFAFVLLMPLDVLTNWRITVDDKDYRPRESITLHIAYTKLKSVNGESNYYLDCENPRGNTVRYPISQSEGNRPEGKGRTDIDLKLPNSISNLPAKCRIAISVDYQIYTFRNFVENNQSNEFIVKE